MVEEYGLDGVADRIFVERAAMYLIRLARAESYEAWIGVSERSAALGSYITRLDRSLRELLRELAVTRASRIRMEARDALTVGLDELIEKFVRRSEKIAEGRRVRKPLVPVKVYRRVGVDWLRGER